MITGGALLTPPSESIYIGKTMYTMYVVVVPAFSAAAATTGGAAEPES
jgi:hypothetical protein